MRQDAARAFTHSLGCFRNFCLITTRSFERTHTWVRTWFDTGAPFPVITYSMSGLMSSHMTLFEELASHGYVVLCIGHPYWNPFVYGSGGEALPFDRQNEHYKVWWAEADSVRRGRGQVSG